MPTVTCPYCQKLSSSKFQHKLHLRVDHLDQFRNNLTTTITGSVAETHLDAIQRCSLINGTNYIINGTTIEFQSRTSIGDIHFSIPLLLLSDMLKIAAQYLDDKTKHIVEEQLD